MPMRVLVTRPVEQATSTARKLSELGHQSVVAPLMKIRYFENVGIEEDGFNCIVASSSRALFALAGHPKFSNLRNLPLYCVGEHSAEIAEQLGFGNVANVGRDVEELCGILEQGQMIHRGKVLYVVGVARKPTLENYFFKLGLNFKVVELYESGPIKSFPEDVIEQIGHGQIDAVLVFSKRSGEFLVDALNRTGLRDRFKSLEFYSISNAAAEPLYELGDINVHVAEIPSESALLKLL